MLNLSVYQLFNVLGGPVPHMCGLSEEHIWLQHEKLLQYACYIFIPPTRSACSFRNATPWCNNYSF